MSRRSLPQQLQCFSASARSCTIRSRTTFFARGCRPLRLFVCSWSGLSCCSSTAGSDSSSSGSLTFQSDSNNASCSFESCSLFRVRCASSSSRSRLRNLSFSELSCRSCSQRSTTILRNDSTSFGRVLGSIAGTMCLQHSRKPGRFQTKQAHLEMFLRRASLETLAPFCILQIYAAQHRAQFFHTDLKPLCTGFSGGDCERTGLKAFCPNCKSASVSSRPGESHPEPLTEPCLNLSIYTALVVQP